MTEFTLLNQSNEKLTSKCNNLNSELTRALSENEKKKQELNEITKAINGLFNKWNQHFNFKLT